MREAINKTIEKLQEKKLTLLELLNLANSLENITAYKYSNKYIQIIYNKGNIYDMSMIHADNNSLEEFLLSVQKY